MRTLAQIAFLILVLVAGAAQAQVRSVEVRTPRPFGYVLGDLVRAQVDIVVEDGFTLQAASLPQAGALTYWLDLRDVAVTRSHAGGATRLRLDLTYQTFYAALDARALEIPGFTLTFVRDAATAAATVPAWSFTTSPLREIQPAAKADPQDYMRPDGRVAPRDPRPTLLAGLGCAGLALLAGAGLARDRAWWPFRARRGRAFAKTLTRIRKTAAQGESDAAYRQALLALHGGLDEAAGRRVLADDLPRFLDRHPAYRGREADLARFFSASRLAFFADAATAARERLPPAEVLATARRLAAAERAS